MADEHDIKGAELASMLKSSIKFKSSDGLKEPGLHLTDEQIQWWQDAKFGLFIHWGLYSLHGRGEWLMFNEKIPAEEYVRSAEQFTPRKFDAGEWARIAKDAGMRYSVMVARHHDGFALWDSPSSYLNFTSVGTAAKRDFVREYADAFQSAGFHTGLYYSLMDWRFPGYFQPRELAESAEKMKAQCYGQIEELMSRYGKIEALWYDGGWLAHQGTDAGGAWLWEPIKLNQMARRYQPGIVINERSGWEGDIETDEGLHEVNGPIMPIRWEKCFSLSHSWGFSFTEEVLPYERVLSLLVNTWVRGGNVLLNVGPDGDGQIPPAQAAVLARIGAFLRENGEAVFATRPGPFQPVDHVCGSTFRGSAVYLHVFNPCALGALPALPQRVLACHTLQGEAVPFAQDEHGIRITIPVHLWREVDTVIMLDLDAPAQPQAGSSLETS
jgi:alpha-L-fucosidase